MPKVVYGNATIEYVFVEKPELKAHYITVEKDKSVILKGKSISENKANSLVLKKARWIIGKLSLVESSKDADIVTGSRIQYLGKKYYAQIDYANDFEKPSVRFNESKFTILIPQNQLITQVAIKSTLNEFYKLQAKEKLITRFENWSKKTGLQYSKLKFLKFDKRWGSCTSENTILVNYLAIKLPYTLIDYLIVHELCHTIEKSHSKAFYNLVSKHLSNWKTLDERMVGMKM